MKQVLPDIRAVIENTTGSRVAAMTALSGGCIGDVYKVTLANGETLVAKVGDNTSGLEVEGKMLRYLARQSNLPVPEVLHSKNDLLLMTFISGGGGLNDLAQVHAADLLADLHGISADQFGFEFDTVIGGLPQPNCKTDRWLDFFAKNRLLAMARQGLDGGRLGAVLMGRIEKLAANLDRWLVEPARPALVHGDIWGGNVLAENGRITGFIDPAIYFADREIELAFTTLFGTFNDAFFARYGEHWPIAPGFFEQRRDLYNLYPLLVHVRLFGGSYVVSVDNILKKFGF